MSSLQRLHIWTWEDIDKLLTAIEQRGVARLLDKKVQRNHKTYVRLQIDLQNNGVTRDCNQIREKWKSLKKKFAFCQKNVEARCKFPFYEKMDELLAHRRMTAIEREKLPLPTFPEEDMASTLSGEVISFPVESSSSSRQENESDDEEDRDDQFHQFLDIIRSEGEKDRKTTLHAVDMLVNSMNENINKLIQSQRVTHPAQPSADNLEEPRDNHRKT